MHAADAQTATRATLPDAPVTETVVARWFGPAQALSQLPGGIARMIDKPLRVTTVSPLTGVHRLRDLRTMLIDPASLTLPQNYRQARWSGSIDAAAAAARRKSCEVAGASKPLTPALHSLIALPGLTFAAYWRVTSSSPPFTAANDMTRSRYVPAPERSTRTPRTNLLSLPTTGVLSGASRTRMVSNGAAANRVVALVGAVASA